MYIVLPKHALLDPQPPRAHPNPTQRQLGTLPYDFPETARQLQLARTRHLDSFEHEHAAHTAAAVAEAVYDPRWR